MPEPIRVLPNADDAVGMMHPIDGPLTEEGAVWSLDDFTVRQLHNETIRREEKSVDAPQAPKAAKTTKTEAPAA